MPTDIKKCFDTVDCSGSHYLKEEWEESKCRDALFSNRTGNFDDSDNTKVADMKVCSVRSMFSPFVRFGAPLGSISPHNNSDTI